MLKYFYLNHLLPVHKPKNTFVQQTSDVEMCLIENNQLLGWEFMALIGSFLVNLYTMQTKNVV